MRLIDADALKYKINEKKVVGRFNTLLLIDNTPEVEERPTGKWHARRNKYYSGGGYYFCNKCNQRFSFGAYFELNKENFCPHCGAKMENKEDGNGK